MADYSRNRRTSEESESFFCRFTFGQFFALLVLEVFTLFFVFYLGARYGREFLGLDRKQTTHIVGEAPSQQQEATKITTTDDPEARQMAKDLIAKAKTPELKERIAEMLGKEGTPSMESPKPVASPNVPERALPQGDEATPPREERKEMSLRPPPQPGDERGGVIRVKSAENARYSIQVGSYQQMAEATALVESWKEKGYPAYMMIADIPNRGRWYRVRLGGFASRADASRYLAKLRAKENISDALIVLNEQ